MTELEIRLNEQLRIYRESPGVTATYIDLARIIETLLTVLEMRKVNGFKEEEK